MDAGLAKVLNSTVGTNNFRSLDKVLYGRKALIPSENLYFNIGAIKNRTLSHTAGASAPAETEVSVVSLKMWTDGGFSIKVTYKLQDDSGVSNRYITGGFRLYINGKLVKTVSDISYDTSSTSAKTIDSTLNDIYFATGDLLELKMFCVPSHPTSSYTGTVTLRDSDVIAIYADEVDKMFDITYAQ